MTRNQALYAVDVIARLYIVGQDKSIEQEKDKIRVRVNELDPTGHKFGLVDEARAEWLMNYVNNLKSTEGEKP